MSDMALLLTNKEQQQQATAALPLVFHMQLPMLEKGAPMLIQALDFGKPLKDTTRSLAVQQPRDEHQRLFPYYPVALLDILVTAPNPKSLRTAVHGLLESVELSLKTLQIFAPTTAGHLPPSSSVSSSKVSSPLLAQQDGSGMNNHKSRNATNADAASSSSNSTGKQLNGSGGAQPLSFPTLSTNNNASASLMMGAKSKSSSSFDRSSSFASAGGGMVVVKQSPRLTAHQPTVIGDPAFPRLDDDAV